MRTNVCKFCLKSFKTFVKVDGKKKYLHKRSYCLECRPYGSPVKIQLRLKHRKEKVCSGCKVLKPVEQFHRITGRHIPSECKKCQAARSLARQRRFKLLCINYKGGACQYCGYSKCVWALEFHHKDRTQKKFGIAKTTVKIFGPSVMEELDKCILMCANCHREEEERVALGLSDPPSVD